MKRNKYGINLDEGIALSSDEEFATLYIESDSHCERRLLDWLNKTEEKNALMFGGQIGCGKTTLIEQAMRLANRKPDVILHFDKNDLNLAALDAWIVVFAGLARFAAEKYFYVLTDSLPDIQAIFGTTPEEINESASQVLLEKFSPAALQKHQKLKMVLESFLNYLPEIFRTTVRALEQKLARSLVFLAAGVDKFAPNSTAYISLWEPLTVLASFKTLFEVNAVHLFSQDRWANRLEKVFLTAASLDWTTALLNKRLGVYAEAYQQDIPKLAKLSGGIPRQALRLLDYFVTYKNNISQQPALPLSVVRVGMDFFAFSKRPSDELMSTVSKQKYLETSLISLPGDNETAMRAVFGNWIIIDQHVSESRWQAIINPVIGRSLSSAVSEDAEMSLLRKYANQQGMAATGLDIDKNVEGWQHALLGSLEKPVELNITEILDVIASALLSKQRQDRIIVAYENRDNFAAVRAYLEAKSNTYEYQVWRHSVAEGGAGCLPLLKMLEILADNAIDIFSIELAGDFTPEQLTELNIRRDTFIDKQIIWWIPKNKLNLYFKFWIQLRQLFQVFVLEDDLSKALSAEEIEADLDFMEELVESENSAAFSYVENLKIVLNYLQGRQDER